MLSKTFLSVVTVREDWWMTQGKLLTLDSIAVFGRGNFLEILTAFGAHDKVIKEKLNGPRNAQYVHHSVQDSILSILAK